MFDPTEDSTPEFRSVCYRCHKASVVCVCSTVARVSNRTGVSIVQHPRERFHPIGTVRFARLGLEDVRVIVHGPKNPAPPILDLLPPRAGLLYPGPAARVLSEVPEAERPEHLLVLDGTWKQARSLYRSLPELAQLPHFSIAPKRPGQYRIRREPTETALSTIEAIVEALAILEPSTPGLPGLLEAFTRMIDRQIVYTRLVRPRVPRRTRRPRGRHLPEVFGLAPERVVVAYGEFVAASGPGSPHELVYWTACRLATGDTFQRVLCPASLSADHPTDRQLGHMGLSRGTLESGIDLATFLADWRAFFREGDSLATWNQSTRELFEALTGEGAAMVMKAIYCNTRKARSGGLAGAMAAEGLEPVKTPFIGRPGMVMGQSLAIARLLQNIASGR